MEVFSEDDKKCVNPSQMKKKNIEELGEREGGGGGGRTKPGPKPGPKTGTARFAHPLRGAEVLVAVRGPSPGEGGGKKTQESEKIAARIDCVSVDARHHCPKCRKPTLKGSS